MATKPPTSWCFWTSSVRSRPPTDGYIRGAPECSLSPEWSPGFNWRAKDTQWQAKGFLNMAQFPCRSMLKRSKGSIQQEPLSNANGQRLLSMMLDDPCQSILWQPLLMSRGFRLGVGQKEGILRKTHNNVQQSIEHFERRTIDLKPCCLLHQQVTKCMVSLVP